MSCILIFCFNLAEVKNQEYNVSYFSNGEAITLKCRCKVSFWSGPVVTNVENGTSPIMITDIYGQYQVLNVSIYFHSGKIADSLPQILFEKLNVIGENFDLRITNLSTSNEGLYICDLSKQCLLMPEKFLLQNKCK